jgi:hypothetical protein
LFSVLHTVLTKDQDELNVKANTITNKLNELKKLKDHVQTILKLLKVRLQHKTQELANNQSFLKLNEIMSKIELYCSEYEAERRKIKG